MVKPQYSLLKKLIWNILHLLGVLVLTVCQAEHDNWLTRESELELKPWGSFFFFFLVLVV